MTKSINTSRIIGLLVMVMAAMVMLSGPVAGVLDLAEPTAQAKKKHKKKRPPAFNVVQCVNGQFCSGTAGNDFLMGTDLGETISGEEGNDIYKGEGGIDSLIDLSPTSNDLYTGYTGDFGNDLLSDRGGSADLLDLVALRALDDVAFVRDGDSLLLDGPGNNNVLIVNYFAERRIETIRFANFTVTGMQAASLAREATSEEQAALEEQRVELEESRPEKEHSSKDKGSSEEE